MRNSLLIFVTADYPMQLSQEPVPAGCTFVRMNIRRLGLPSGVCSTGDMRGVA